MTDELVVELGLEPAGDELGGGERVAGGGVSLMLTRPVSLTNNKPILSHPGLGPPLLYVRPSHLQQSNIIHSYCHNPSPRPDKPPKKVQIYFQSL